MKLYELYALSLIEPPDVIESIDPHNAERIKKFNEYEKLRLELIKERVTIVDKMQMRLMRQHVDSGGDINELFRIKNPQIEPRSHNRRGKQTH